MFSATASAATYLNLPATSSTSTFTVTFGGGDTYTTLSENVNGTWTTVSGVSGTATGSVQLTRVDGTHTFRVVGCAVVPNPPAGPITTCTVGATKSIVVDTVPDPVVSAGFTPTSVNEGGSATFSWSASNATSCSATGISGVSGTSGSITYHAPTNMSANQTVTVNLTCNGSGGSTAKTATLHINWLNDTPTISNIANKTINEDGNTGNIAFTVSDEETAAGSLTVTATSSNTILVPNSSSNLTLGGTGGSRTIKVTPVANKYGTTTITVTVSDGSHSANDTFVVTVNAVNDAPTLSSIGNVSIDEGASTSAIAFTVGDLETAAGSLTVTASSSNTAIIPSGNIALGGSGASRNITISARPGGGVGSSTITVTVSDGALSSSKTFTVTVNNIPATLTVPATDSDGDGTYIISWLGGGNDVRIYESYNGGVSAQIVQTSSPSGQHTITHTQNGTYEYGIAECHYVTISTPGGPVQQLQCSGQSGGSTVVSGLNDPPSISDIGDQAINEDSNTGNIPFIVSDTETAAGSLTVTATSSNTTLIPNSSSNLTLGGTGGSRTIKVTPAANQYGTATITVSVSDGINPPVSDSFVVTVTDRPDLNLPVTSSTSTFTVTFEGLGTYSLLQENVNGSWETVSGEDGGILASVELTRADGTYTFHLYDCTITPNPPANPITTCTIPLTKSIIVDAPAPAITAGFSPTPINEGGSAMYTWSVTGATSCSGTGLSGISGASGNVTYNAPTSMSAGQTVTVNLSCTGLGGSSTKTSTLNVNWINDTPTISGIPNKIINEDGNTGDLTFTVSDEETAAGSLIVTASSDNQALIPDGNITLTGSGASRIVRATPVTNQSGTATVTVSVSDGANPPVIDQFMVTVTAVNDVPTITPFSDISVSEGTAIDEMQFTVGDIETLPGSLQVNAYSDDQTLIPNANLVLGGSGAGRTLMVIPANGQTGKANITVEVSDGQDTTPTSFIVSIVGTPDPFDFGTDAPPEFQYDLNDTTLLPTLGAGEFVALTEGELNVNDGAAVYTVPIELPPAVNGLKPKLALAYHSRGGNDLMGVGWSLSGLSTISRCSPTVATEGAEAQDSNRQYTNADRLCLDGKKLEIASSTNPATDSAYWAVGAEYRTEVDSFAKVQAFGTLNGAHQYFEVRTKDGRILTYGSGLESQNSRIYATGQGSTGPVGIWALDKVEDRYGNQYTIHYQNNNADGDYYPTHIDFVPGASVVFSYIDRDANNAATDGYRSDMPWGYDAGHIYKRPKLLDKITTTIDGGSTAVREYNVNYQRSATTDRYLISDITECGFENGLPVCAAPLTFGWQAGELGFEATATPLQSCAGQPITVDDLQIGDIDNDGYEDLLGKTVLYWGGPTCFEQAGAWAMAGSANWQVAQLIGTPNGKALLVTQEDLNSSASPKAQFINVIELDRAASTATVHPLLSTAISPTAMVVMDLNNDGLEDVLFGTHTWIQQAGGSVTFTAAAANNAGLQLRSTGQPLDYSGDGLADLFVSHMLQNFNGNYYYTDISAYTNIGTGAFTSDGQLPVSDTVPFTVTGNDPFHQRFLAGGSQTYNLVDVNGDGKRDYVYHQKPSGQPDGLWYVKLNTGNGFGPPLSIGVSAGEPTNQYSFPYDWDKDGRQDLIVRDASLIDYCQDGQDCWNVVVSNYNGGYGVEVLGVDPFNGHLFGGLANTPVAIPKYQVLRGDFNHDGMVDISYGSNIWFAKQQQPDLLQTVTNGLAAQITLEYSPLVYADNHGQPLYTPSSQKPVFPRQHVPRDVQVVKKLSVSDGQGGLRDRYFNYAGAKQDVQGRGFLGFEEIQVTDMASDRVTTVTYRQDFPYIGNMSSVEVKDTAGNLISLAANHYAVHSLNSRFPYLDYSIQRQYGLTTTSSGSPLSVTKATNTFDAYGNLTDQTTTIGTGLSGTTVTGVKRIVTVDNTVITNNTADWLLGFIEERTETATEAGGANARSVTTEFDPEPGTLDVRVRRDFVGTPIWKTTTTTRNASGVVTGVAAAAGDIDVGTAATRTTTWSNFTGVMYPQTQTNALSHAGTLGYDTRFGVVNSETDPNSLTATRVYDALGRLASETGPDGTVSTTKRFYCASAPVTCPANAVYLVATEITNSGATGKLGAPLSVVFYDKLQREVRRQTYSLNGAVAKVDTEYYADGRVYRVSEPDTGVSAGHWTVSSNYDALNRPHDTSGADGGSVHADYTQEGGLQKTVATVTVITPEGNRTQISTRYTNALGQIERVLDDAGTPIDYTYDTQGNLKTTTVNNNAATTVTIIHDVAGNKTSIDDPDAGSIDFEYNGFGELRRQTWQSGTADEKSIEYTYDSLGRKTGRTDTPVSGTPVSYSWSWDTAKKGLLDSRSGNGFTESYTYDSQARLATRTTAISGLMGSRTFSYTYDAFSRPETVTYPDGLKVEHSYHAAGIQAQTRDVTDPLNPKMLWALGENSDTRGGLYQQLFGNGVMTERTVDESSGRISRIQSGRLLGNSVNDLTGSVQDLSFEFDTLGNLYERATGRTDLNGLPLEYTAEIFTYDDLNRLKTSDTLWDSLGTRSRSYNYDALGNLTYRSDIGTLTYDQTNGGGVHAVTAANGQSYHYDAYGNIVQRGTDTLDYDVFNKPTQIGTTTFSYGPDHARFKQVDGTRATYYIGGGQYEEIIDNGVTTQRSYVGGYLVRNTRQGVVTLTYLHTDHLGSVEAMSDELGNFIGRMSFDPWGNRQDAAWEDGNPTGGDPNYYPTTKGYTGHEMLDQVNLIHMNGRVYDPVIGRFLTPDVFIQAPQNTQSFNRYSYVLNNPLSLVDPTGYYCGGPSGGTAYNMLMQQWAYEAASFNTQMSYAMDQQHQQYQAYQAMQSYNATMARVNGITNNTAASNQATNGSVLGNALRHIPIVGGMLGAVGDIVSGVGNTTLGLASFGLSGTLGRGLGQIGAGVSGIGNIFVRDVAAAVAGVAGTIYTTVRDVVDVMALGNVISHGNPIKAIGNMVVDAIIPDYGVFGGKGWGTTQGRTPDMALNSVDYYSYIHDKELGRVPNANTSWVKNQWSSTPSGQAAPGLVGSAYVLAGTLPFLGADLGANLFGGP